MPCMLTSRMLRLRLLLGAPCCHRSGCGGGAGLWRQGAAGRGAQLYC